MTSLRQSQSVLAIRAHTLDLIMRHAHAEAPIEACGIVTDTMRHVPMMNAAASPTFFQFDVDEYLKVFHEIHDAGEHIMLIYHSHTAGPAIPSAMDIIYARPNVRYLIVATETNTARAFTVAEGVVTEETVVPVP